MQYYIVSKFTSNILLKKFVGLDSRAGVSRPREPLSYMSYAGFTLYDYYSLIRLMLAALHDVKSVYNN